MMLSSVEDSRSRLPMPEADAREALKEGRFTDVTLRGVTPHGFSVEGVYLADSGLPVPAVLVTRAGTEKTIKCPDRALQFLRKLGVDEFEVDVSLWDPSKAFNPARESYLSRQRRQLHEAALARVDELLSNYHAGTELDAEQRLAAVVDQLSARRASPLDLRALVLCWGEVYLPRFPIPSRAEKALYRFASGAKIEAENLTQQLSEYCGEEFKRRCKNQYLASLDLGEVN